ncbi:hypothetical protein POUND7_017368, partial [Theobroma cacao]
VNYYV